VCEYITSKLQLLPEGAKALVHRGSDRRQLLNLAAAAVCQMILQMAIETGRRGPKSEGHVILAMLPVKARLQDACTHCRWTDDFWQRLPLAYWESAVRR